MSKLRYMGIAFSILIHSSSAFAQEPEWEISELEEWGPSLDASWDPDWTESWYQPSPPWSLSFVGGRRTGALQATESGLEVEAFPRPLGTQSRAELYAFATLQIPLDGLMARTDTRGKRRNPPAVSDASSGNVFAQTSATETGDAEPAQGSLPTENGGNSSAKAPAAPKMAPAQPGENPPIIKASSSAQRKNIDKQQVTRELLVLVKKTLARTRDAEGSQLSVARLNALVKRARLSGWVPELRLRGVYGLDRTTSLRDATGIIPGETTLRGRQDSLLEARLTFRLDRVLYGTQESTFSRQKADVEGERQKRARAALSELTKWLAAERKVNDPALFEDQRLKALMESEGALLQLHLMTGGWFEGQATLKNLGLQKLMDSLIQADGETFEGAADDGG